MRVDSNGGIIEVVKGEERRGCAHSDYLQHQPRKRGPVDQGGAYRRNHGVHTRRSSARSGVFHRCRRYTRRILSRRYGRCFPGACYNGTPVTGSGCNSTYAARDDPRRSAGCGWGGTTANGAKVRLEPTPYETIVGRGCALGEKENGGFEHATERLRLGGWKMKRILLVED